MFSKLKYKYYRQRTCVQIEKQVQQEFQKDLILGLRRKGQQFYYYFPTITYSIPNRIERQVSYLLFLSLIFQINQGMMHISMTNQLFCPQPRLLSLSIPPFLINKHHIIIQILSIQRQIQDLRMPSHPSYQNAYKKQGFIFKKNPPHQNMPNRSIITNVPDLDVCDNSIKTSKYTPITFIPKNLFVQFSKVANLYFLIVGIMQMIPQITVSGGFPVIFIPLSIVVGVSAIKDFYEDLKRKKSDYEINGKKTMMIDKNGNISQTIWMKLRIGNVIKVQKDQPFPADVILLCSSQCTQNCFIETKNLDGETNLKIKKIKPEISQIFLPHISVASEGKTTLHTVHQQFKYQKPNPYIHTFTGSYKNCPLDNNNIVLRGCSLKITKWVYGLIIYTGIDSKIMLNSNKTRQKKSRLEFKMGIIVAIIFIVQMSITFFCALMSVLMSKNGIYAALTGWAIISTTNQLMIKWGSWILLFTNFVPISLIVSLQMVKYIQGINISNSQFHTREPSQVSVQTSTLNEQLGQIQHVFSDKTGTLTKNYMSFKYMVVGANLYGYDNQIGIKPNKKKKAQGENIQSCDEITNVDFHDQKFLDFVKKQRLSLASNCEIFDMLLSFSICHNVILEVQQNKTNQKPKITFNASSPDELAFINMARYCGWEYQGIDANNIVTVRYQDQKLKYRLLHTIQFNSDRKRMSIIIQELKEDAYGHNGKVNKAILQSNENRIFVYSKGADNVIIERLKSKDQSVNKYLKTIKQNLESWSVNGLRTLVFAKRQIKKQYYLKWARMYAFSLSRLDKLEKQQNKSLKKTVTDKSYSNRKQNRSHKNQQIEEENIKLVSAIGRLFIDQYGKNDIQQESPTTLINKLLNDNSMLTESQKKFLQQHLVNIDEGAQTSSDTKQLEDIIERELEIIGATAIEDKLQDNVKLTIERLRFAGVKVWMLTGDKKQTAINIGISCGLISEDMGVVHWKNSVEQVIQERRKYPQNRQCCLVVTGQDLLRVTQQAKLLELVNLCKSIICCRVTPKQKQDMVWMMRKNKCTTLSIGDGANDVNMINTAHVGVGIKGVEGAQAALCSDYAITQFQILGQLMLYHGRESYRKNSQLILFNFYKNLILVLPQLWYGLNNSFSSANIYDPWIYQLYNVVYTSIPIAIFAIYDEKFPTRYSLQHPQLYREGLYNKLFNNWRIFLWFIFPVIFSFFLATLTFIGLQESINSRGYMFDMVSSGMCIFAQCVIICNIRVLTISFKYSIGLLLSIFVGVISFWLTMALAAKVFSRSSEIVNMLSLQLSTPEYWLTIIVNVGLVFIIEYGMSNWNNLIEKIQTYQSKKHDEIQLPLIGIKEESEQLEFSKT